MRVARAVAHDAPQLGHLLRKSVAPTAPRLLAVLRLIPLLIEKARNRCIGP